MLPPSKNNDSGAFIKRAFPTLTIFASSITIVSNIGGGE